MFNSHFYQPNTTATIEHAELRLTKLGYSNFTFNSCSRSNGASFYFTLENGQQVRVSDHPLTGNRAFDVIQVSLYEIKTLPSASSFRKSYLSGELTKKEYKAICKENGFIFKP